VVRCLVHRNPKIGWLVQLHAEHPEAVEVSLISAGLRWRDVGTPEVPWSDAWAILTTQAWDSPLAKALKPDEWYWYDPHYPVVVDSRDLLRVIATKMQVNPKVRREHIPSPTKPPWATDAGTTKYAPEPSTEDEVMAHLERLNGRRG
jgi:hypothetical protein